MTRSRITRMLPTRVNDPVSSLQTPTFGGKGSAIHRPLCGLAMATFMALSCSLYGVKWHGPSPEICVFRLHDYVFPRFIQLRRYVKILKFILFKITKYMKLCGARASLHLKRNVDALRFKTIKWTRVSTCWILRTPRPSMSNIPSIYTSWSLTAKG